MENYLVNQTCPKCHKYLLPPLSWGSVTPPPMCTCNLPKADVGWICPRCGSSNAPTKLTCGCASSDPLKVT